MPTYESVLGTVKPALEPGEKLVEIVAGVMAGESLHTIAALTNRRILVHTPTGHMTIDFANLAGVSWAPTWARLNIDTKSPRRRMVLAVFGSDWKGKARGFAEAARRSVPR
jgi:hypothetical protein